MPSHTLAKMKKPHASSDSHYFPNGFLSMKRLCLAVMAILAAAAFLTIPGGCLSAFPEGEYWPVREQANALATPPELETALRKAADVRWSDTGLVRSASRMSTWTGLAVYEELARTILLNYVEEVSCSDLVRGGLRNLKASLDADAFRKHFDVMGDPGKLAQFKKRLDGIDHAVALTETNSVAEAKRWIELVLAENERSVDLPPGVVLAEFILGAADCLDRYSLYMTPKMLSVFKERMRGKYVGVGISVGVEKGEVVVKSVIANSPAEKSEIAVGDKIISVDDKTLSADSLGEVVRTIRGPKGTQVKLLVRRPGEKEEKEIVLTRAQVFIPSVRDAKMIEEGVGYVAVDAFNSDTARDLSGAIAELKREKMSGLVLDLRNNPGGLLFSAVSVCGVFTRGERVATTTGRGIWEGWKYDVSPVSIITWDGPLVIVVGPSTASAAEVVAAALRAHERALLVGQRTYGKGVMQCVFPLEWGQSAIELTTARLKDPRGNVWDGNGIIPDVVVTADAGTVGAEVARPAGRDATLDAAVRAVRLRIENARKAK